ncbi:uncharacterized protein GGS22DRAFT_200502 [Annulohypoxylon maeteangense]|uniref:uncharacterized protein n=1 Tax=Annulohypoxylon maeteangense TaxID=1927788 RepID=UPI0020087E34|nr:uncharacterized protein GGS22DRAFT_200502 [Annulohypoxylon maeteangense]KAI0884832.1 hypothetical protein GGS22DRAFT_200502 [Annulohypoxylon maeteangense]
MASPPSHPSTSSETHGIDDMDDISLNSTDHEGDSYEDDKEWVVEDVYAERPHLDKPGELQYLIKWEGFPLDECTWEPIEHLGPGLLTDWEETKEKIKAGIRLPFDVERYNQAYREKEERKRRRNAKRKRLGLLPPLLPPTPEPPETPTLRSLEDSPTMVSKDEPALNEGAQDADGIKPSLIIPETRPPDVPKQKVPKTVPSEKSRVDVNGTPKANKKKQPRQPTPVSSSKSPPIPNQAKRRASSDATTNTTKTGYQGTARKSSGSASTESSKAAKNKTSSQNPPASVPKPSPGMPPRIMSSLANKFGVKKHTATRTRPQPTAPPKRTKNVFVGGKERRKRASLNDVMDDPSKAPKAFSSMHVMNIAKKRGLERNDGAPPSLSSIPPSFIVTNNRNSIPTADQAKANVPSAPPEPPPLVQSPTTISPTSATNALPIPKARKSVRFTEAQDFVPEDTPMTDATTNIVDYAVGGQDDMKRPPESPVSAKALASPRKLSLATYQERSQVQVVAKTAVFGKPGSESIRVVFSGIPRQPQQWLSAFVALETLNFNSICTSYNFIPYKSDLVQETLSTGAIETNSGEIKSALANIAEHLRRSSYGSHLVTEHFSIIVYPSNCSAWDGLDIDKNNSESPLRHMIYRSPVDARLYPPVSIPRAPARLSDIKAESHCRVLSERLFGLEMSQFIPQEPKQKDKQVFMLLFPKREAQVCNFVKLWLRSCQPDCRIFSNEIKDSWAKFHETVRAGAAGTIILHEDVSVAIRQLPRLSLLFQNRRCYTFWDLATGQYSVPRFPSYGDAAIGPGTLQMTRLFPSGRAFLITPSFALSDPVRLCQFLEWFRNYCVNPHYLIMACADFPNYLKAITLEKAKEHETIYSTRRNDPRREEMMTELGLSRADLEARFRSWEVLKDIMDNFGDEEASEDIRKVHWITDLIDPNDEQSLVNWFCWWSTLKCDQYRKFTVLGSSNHKNRAAYRNIEIPVYTAETVGDPDIALISEGKRRRAEEAASTTEHVGAIDQDTPMSPGHTNTGFTPATPASRTFNEFKSDIFKNDSASEIRYHITAIFNQSRKGNWAKLHVNPVSWLNVNMADHFGDPRCEYDTFKNWIGRTPAFNRSSNTWYGLFYTIDREWDSKAPPQTYGRHAWIAAVRPVNPHLSPNAYSRMELFVWDIHARDREKNTGSLLLDMQRKLIDIVKQELPLKDSRFYLEKVHVSSNTYLEFKPSDNILDVTYRRLQEVMNDGKTWMPPFDNLLRDRDWISLTESEWSMGATMRFSDYQLSAQQHEPPPRHHSDEGKMQRLVWHAPRAKVKVEKTKCRNHLYECAMESRKQNGSYQTMGYQYKSTLDWYYDMKCERRDANHVDVDSAEKILAKLLQKK